jgi:hypothetical protein
MKVEDFALISVLLSISSAFYQHLRVKADITKEIVAGELFDLIDRYAKIAPGCLHIDRREIGHDYAERACPLPNAVNVVGSVWQDEHDLPRVLRDDDLSAGDRSNISIWPAKYVYLVALSGKR